MASKTMELNEKYSLRMEESGSTNSGIALFDIGLYYGNVLVLKTNIGCIGVESGMIHLQDRTKFMKRLLMLMEERYVGYATIRHCTIGGNMKDPRGGYRSEWLRSIDRTRLVEDWALEMLNSVSLGYRSRLKEEFQISQRLMDAMGMDMGSEECIHDRCDDCIHWNGIECDGDFEEHELKDVEI